MPPLGEFPSEYCYAVWHGKTRMTWLPEGENILMLRLFVLTQSRNVTDKQTVTQTPHDGRPRLYIASRGKKMVPFESLCTVSYWHSIVTMYHMQCIISQITRDAGWKLRFFSYPCIRRPRWRIPLGILSYRLVWKNLNGAAKKFDDTLCLAVSIEYRRVTDGQTDRQADRQTDGHLATA